MANKDDLTELKKLFSSNLKSVLSERKMKQVDLRKAIIDRFNVDVGKENISNWCKGKYFPMGNSMIYICKVLDIDETVLLSDRIAPLDRKTLEQKELACNIIEKCFGINARDIVLKLLKLNDNGLIAANEYIDFLLEQDKYKQPQKKVI